MENSTSEIWLLMSDMAKENSSGQMVGSMMVVGLMVSNLVKDFTLTRKV